MRKCFICITWAVYSNLQPHTCVLPVAKALKTNSRCDSWSRKSICEAFSYYPLNILQTRLIFKTASYCDKVHMLFVHDSSLLSVKCKHFIKMFTKFGSISFRIFENLKVSPSLPHVYNYFSRFCVARQQGNRQPV